MYTWTKLFEGHYTKVASSHDSCWRRECKCMHLCALIVNARAIAINVISDSLSEQNQKWKQTKMNWKMHSDSNYIQESALFSPSTWAALGGVDLMFRKLSAYGVWLKNSKHARNERKQSQVTIRTMVDYFHLVIRQNWSVANVDSGGCVMKLLFA